MKRVLCSLNNQSYQSFFFAASIYAAAALGPVFGYALGAFMLQHPMDMWSTNKILHPDLNPTSADWIGAWWAGYIILGELSAVISVTLFNLTKRHFPFQDVESFWVHASS